MNNTMVMIGDNIFDESIREYSCVLPLQLLIRDICGDRWLLSN